MWNLFRAPINKATLHSWAKLLDEIAKVAFLAIPVMLYSNESINFRLFNSWGLLFACYSFLVLSRLLRELAERGKK